MGWHQRTRLMIMDLFYPFLGDDIPDTHMVTGSLMNKNCNLLSAWNSLLVVLQVTSLITALLARHLKAHLFSCLN